MWRAKKFLFWVENEGYMLSPALFSRADSHMTGVPLDPEFPLVGLERPLVLMSPGLAQPPPGTGDGLRDKDISELGVPVDGNKMISSTLSATKSISIFRTTIAIHNPTAPRYHAGAQRSTGYFGLADRGHVPGIGESLQLARG